MPATPSRIGFITQAFRITTAGPLPAVGDLYGNAARKTVAPLPTFFDNTADADVMAEERLALLGAQRSLFTAQIDSADTALDIAQDTETGLATARLIDDEQDRDTNCIVVGFTADMNAERSTLVTWG